jgi:hypothetical protein
MARGRRRASLGIWPGTGFAVCASNRPALHLMRLDVARLGLERAAALYRLYPTRFRLDATLSLVGSRKALAAIGSGDDPRDVIAMWRSSWPRSRMSGSYTCSIQRRVTERRPSNCR